MPSMAPRKRRESSKDLKQQLQSGLDASHPHLGTPDIAEPGTRTVTGSAFTEMLREEMQRTLEHAERYGWGV